MNEIIIEIILKKVLVINLSVIKIKNYNKNIYSHLQKSKNTGQPGYIKKITNKFPKRILKQIFKQKKNKI